MERREKTGVGRTRIEQIFAGIRVGCTTRASLARYMGVSPMTVGRAVNGLTEEGVLTEREGYLAVSDRFCRFFLSIDSKECEARSEDLAGVELCRFRVPYEEAMEAWDNLDMLLGRLQERMALLGVKKCPWSISVKISDSLKETSLSAREREEKICQKLLTKV